MAQCGESAGLQFDGSILPVQNNYCTREACCVPMCTHFEVYRLLYLIFFRMLRKCAPSVLN